MVLKHAKVVGQAGIKVDDALDLAAAARADVFRRAVFKAKEYTPLFRGFTATLVLR